MVFAYCNLEVDASTVAAIAKATTDFNTCRIGSPVDQTSCTADRTATMLAAHARIGAVGSACHAGAYPSTPVSDRPEPPKARFNGDTAYTAAASTFDTGAFVRCNTAALDASVAAGVEIGEHLQLLAVYPGICAVRTACIAAGHPPAPALPRAHPGEYPTRIAHTFNNSVLRALVPTA
jgi:hypothetical protein